MKSLTFPALSTKLAAEAWTKKKTKRIEMDVRLAEAFAEIIDRELSKPNLGCATTRQLLNELWARSDLNYSTVFAEAIAVGHPCPTTSKTQLTTPTTNA